jgi:hypothetical protein
LFIQAENLYLPALCFPVPLIQDKLGVLVERGKVPYLRTSGCIGIKDPDKSNGPLFKIVQLLNAFEQAQTIGIGPNQPV